MERQHWAPSGAADTPYRRAAQEWDNRMGTAVVQAANWRRAAFGAIALALVAVGGLIYLGALPKAVPHIVQVDGLGKASYVGPVGVTASSYTPSDAVLRYHLRRFVE